MLFGKTRNEYAHSSLKIHIAKYKDYVNRILQVCSVVFSLVTIICIICYHGLYISTRWKDIIRIIIDASLFFYVLKYFILLFYSLHRKEFLKRSWFECIIISLLIIQFISYYVFNFDLRMVHSINFENYYILFIQFYFLIIVLIELAKMNSSLGKYNLSPPILMVASFLLLIAIGTVLLSLPRMTVHGISLIDALFTATSASCVTGLTTVSTSACFTVKGQVVIMLLMQLGGMSILTFATFFTTFLSRSFVGLRYQYLIRDMMSADRLSDSITLLRSIMLTTVVIELSGTALLFTYWKTTGFFVSDAQNVFYALFYSIAAFNNAGFALWDGSLMNMGVVDSYFPQTVIMILVLLGGIGFVTIRDFFSVHYIKERNKYHWKSLMPQTKIVLLTSFYIILIGTILFLFIESKYSLKSDTSLFDRIFTSLLQVVTCRTAGFTVVDMNTVSMPTLILLMLIIFIGCSPSSTGGGIKTTTFFVLIKSVLATIQGKKHIEFQHKTIPFSLVDKANSIVIMSFSFILLSCFLITIMEPDLSLSTAIFETTSAFTTCGLSTGACASMCWGAKLVLIINMYIGRIGTLTLAFALTRRKKESKHQYPDLYLMIG